MTQSDRLRKLADDLDFYSQAPIADDLRRAVGVEVAVLGAEIMSGEEPDAMKTVTINLTNAHGKGPPYVVTERPGRGGPLRRLAARLQRNH